MTCWWHQDIEQNLFSALGLKVRQPIHWPCDLFPGPPSIYNHNESYVYAGNAWHSLRWPLQRDPKYFWFVSLALFSPYFITIGDNKCFLKISQVTGSAQLQMARRPTMENTCFQNAVKVFQKPHCLKRECMRTFSEIASVFFIAADSAAGESSISQVLQSTHPVSCHLLLLFLGNILALYIV